MQYVQFEPCMNRSVGGGGRRRYSQVVTASARPLLFGGGGGGGGGSQASKYGGDRTFACTQPPANANASFLLLDEPIACSTPVPQAHHAQSVSVLTSMENQLPVLCSALLCFIKQ